MKVIIAGSRTINDYLLVKSAIEDFVSEVGEITTVISGTANGVDSLGEKYAQECDLPVERYPANWEELGKSAGNARNKEMAAVADALILVWDGESYGSKNMLYHAKKQKLIIKEVK